MRLIEFESVFDLDELVRSVCNVLKDGGVVCLPSDGGYILIVDINSTEKIELIRKVTKNEDPATFLVGEKSQLNELIDTNDMVVGQLVEEFLPGRIIIETSGVGVFESQFLRVRMSESSFYAAFLSAYEGNVVSFEAGIKGKESIYSSEQILNIYEETELIDLLIDDDVLEVVNLPVIVRVEDNQLRFLREGDLVSILASQFSVKE